MHCYRIILLFVLFFILTSCHAEKDNSYFYDINKELSEVSDNQEVISNIYKRELEKYKHTHELKYLLSSKFVLTFKEPDEKSKKVSLIYELLRINDDDYEFITAFCKLSLALEFENTSPKLSLQFLNEAIKIEEVNDEKVLLPHLYHAKGRWYYQHENYSLAKIYFYKALKTFKKDEKLYLASMYNNFSLCDNKLGNIDLAINQTWYGIRILESKKDLTAEEIFFIYMMKGNLGVFYLYKKDYKNAEKYMSEELEFYKYKKKFEDNSVKNIGQLLKVYTITHQKDKEEDLVNYLISIEPEVKKTYMKIYVYEVLQKYYSDKNDLQKLKFVSRKLVELNNESNKETMKDMDNVSDILNGYIIKNINQEYDYKIENQERKNILLIVLVIIIIGIFIKAILDIRRKNKEERELLEGLKNELETNNVTLEKNIQEKQDKIKNLRLNLNLKIENEKAFLENLKKIRRSKNLDAGETVRNLFFQMNNLVQMDEKNHELMYESSLENREFIKIISDKFPQLSEQELKLCVYFRLNLSSKEVSLLENITPGSVRVYKTKIKAKMQLTKEQDLYTFLNSIK